MYKKCNHSDVDDKEFWNGVFVCPRCNKAITKGRKTPNKAFGKCKFLRRHKCQLT